MPTPLAGREYQSQEELARDLKTYFEDQGVRLDRKVLNSLRNAARYRCNFPGCKFSFKAVSTINERRLEPPYVIEDYVYKAFQVHKHTEQIRRPYKSPEVEIFSHAWTLRSSKVTSSEKNPGCLSGNDSESRREEILVAWSPLVEHDTTLTMLCRPFGLGGRDSQGAIPVRQWMSRRALLDMKQQLGDNFVHFSEQPDENAATAVHQSVVMMLAAKTFAPASLSVTASSWPSLFGSVMSGKAISNLAKQTTRGNFRKAIVFVSWTNTPSADTFIALGKFYSEMRKYTDPRVRPYPNEEEANQQTTRKRDIQILDKIASDSDVFEYQFRPVTCFDTQSCTLTDYLETVMKRTSRDFNSGIVLLHKDGERTENLYCGRFKSSRWNPEGQQQESGLFDRWFHQQCIQSLVNFGKYSIFISTTPSAPDEPGSIRGRKGRIISRVWNRSRISKDGVRSQHVEEACNDPTGFLPETSKYLKLEDLERFALYIFGELRALSTPGLESLEVGVRLDIGVSEDHRFFVTNILRWYSAHYYSNVGQFSPSLRIAEEFGYSFQSVLSAL